MKTMEFVRKDLRKTQAALAKEAGIVRAGSSR